MIIIMITNFKVLVGVVKVDTASVFSSSSQGRPERGRGSKVGSAALPPPPMNYRACLECFWQRIFVGFIYEYLSMLLVYLHIKYMCECVCPVLSKDPAAVPYLLFSSFDIPLY